MMSTYDLYMNGSGSSGRVSLMAVEMALKFTWSFERMSSNRTDSGGMRIESRAPFEQRVA